MKPKLSAQMMQASISVQLEPKHAITIPQLTAREILTALLRKQILDSPSQHLVNSLKSHAVEVKPERATKELKAVQIMVPFATPSLVISVKLLAQMEVRAFAIKIRPGVSTTAIFATQDLLVES